MRYSLLSVVVASTLALTACGNKQADNQAAGASATSSTATGATGSNKTPYLPSQVQAPLSHNLFMLNGQVSSRTPLAVK